MENVKMRSLCTANSALNDIQSDLIWACANAKIAANVAEKKIED